jgi:hypothetical protein
LRARASPAACSALQERSASAACSALRCTRRACFSSYALVA